MIHLITTITDIHETARPQGRHAIETRTEVSDDLLLVNELIEGIKQARTRGYDEVVFEITWNSMGFRK